MKIAFVILNYNTYEDTFACIASIEQLIDTEDYRIIIVDNASTNNSVQKLQEEYASHQKIEILLNKENLGFARGNNAGIRYVNEKYQPDYVAVINSDTELLQPHFVRNLEEEYQHSEFAVLAPMVFTNERIYPSHLPFYSISYLENDIKKLENIIKHYSHAIYRMISRLHIALIRIKNRIFKKKKTVGAVSHIQTHFKPYRQQIIPSGCFLVFSKKAFAYIQGFDERTFLYYEESLLFIQLMKNGLVTVFDPEICVHHKSGSSSKTIKKCEVKRKIFIAQCLIDSSKILIEEMKKENITSLDQMIEKYKK